jgi:bifunctional oligoribonuclease and PAP phosphatase NrnA
MTNHASITALLKLIHERQSFIISSHTRPDGDAIGSSLGLMHLLEAMGKHAVVAFTDLIPDMYKCLPGVDRIITHLPATALDAAIFLECDSLQRSSFDPYEFEAVRPALTINIDHHASGRDFANFNWIDAHAPAVGSMIYDLALASGVRITPSIASCLYAAVLTDTGCFAYAGVTASTFGMAEHLVECGADPYLIAQSVFFSNSPAKIRLLGTALSKIHMAGLGHSMPTCSHEPPLESNIAWCAITVDDLERAHATIEDCEGLVSYLIGMSGVEAAIFMRELPSRTGFRLSLRSKGALDISGVAEHFGGGGHRNASGCTIDGSLADVTARVVAGLRAAATHLHTSAVEHPPLPVTLLA